MWLERQSHNTSRVQVAVERPGKGICLWQAGFPLFADVRQHREKSRPLYCILNCALIGGAIPAAFAAKEPALARYHLLKQRDVLVIDVSGSWAALRGAEAATILPSLSHSLAGHFVFRFL